METTTKIADEFTYLHNNVAELLCECANSGNMSLRNYINEMLSESQFGLGRASSAKERMEALCVTYKDIIETAKYW